MTGALVSTLLVVLFAAPATITVSRAHFAKAQKLFAQERYRQALDEFTAASEKAPEEIPDLYYNIGQCHRNLGHARQARMAFEHYLALRPEATDKKQVQALLASLGGQVRPEPAPPVVEEPAAVDETPAAEAVPPPAAPPLAAPAETLAALAPRNSPDPLIDSPPKTPRRRWALWVGVAAGVAVTAIGLGVGLHYGLASSASTPAPANMMNPGMPMLGSTVTFDTRGP